MLVYSNCGAENREGARFCDSCGDDIVPIPGTTRIGHLEENVGSLEVELTEDDLRELESVFPLGAASGDRYSDMTSVNR